jgi:serine O-acetyltransferase
MAAIEEDPAHHEPLPRRRQPRFFDAVIADALITSLHRATLISNPTRGRALLEAVRLCWITDSFLAQVAYRLEARLRDLRVPILPTVLRHLAISIAGLSIGDQVVIAPGLHLAHGEVVIDGETEIEVGVSLFPFVTIAPRPGEKRGPTLRQHATIGTGAKLIGPIEIGEKAQVGANAVTFEDVADDATQVGIGLKQDDRLESIAS